MLCAAVGDKVANVVLTLWQGQTPGTILLQWDEGNAYRIELADEAKTNVWGPIDEDGFVKPVPGVTYAGISN